MTSLRPRSRLYRLPIEGLGGHSVESITSYLMRLATAHLLTVGTLVAQVLSASLVGSRSSRREAASELMPNARAANGLDTEARAWANVVAESTLVDGVFSMTMLPWAAVLPSRDLLAESVRHCRRCLQDMEASGHVYEPLGWQLSMSTICIRHESRLMSACWSCGATQRSLTRTSRPGMCRICGAWLGDAVEVDQSMRPPTDWERFCSSATDDLLAHQPAARDVFDLELIGRTVRAAIDAARMSQKTFAPRAGLAIGALSDLVNGNNRPSTETLFRVCGLGGWSPSALLAGRLEASLRPVAPPNKQRLRRRHDWGAIAVELQDALTLPGEPPSATDVARRLGVDRGLLRDHCPSLVSALTERRRNWIDRATQGRKSEAVAVVRRITSGLLADGRSATRREVEAELPAPFQLRERSLQAAWRSVRST
jgi:transcriptional regulator with XRE-family HTH domain